MAIINGTVSYRGVFKQGQFATTILRVTTIDGAEVDPETITYTVIYEDTDEEVVEPSAPEKVAKGVYVFDWEIPRTADVGRYIIRWKWFLDGEEHIQDEIVVVAKNSKDIRTKFYSGKVLLMRQSLELMIDCAQKIPVYGQQAQPTRDRQKYLFTKGKWNPATRTRIYINKEIATEGFTLDYEEGAVIFDEPLTSYDVVNADYNFRWFTDEQLDRFMSNGIHSLNVFPPATGYDISNIPERWIPVVLYGAAKDALRNLILCLQFEEPAQFFGGPEEAGKRTQALETLKQNYEKDWEKLLEQKKLGPYVGLTRSIVTPEFTLPGGRSRWFRYLFSGSTAAG